MAYGIIYGLGAERLAASLGVNAAEAKRLRSRFLASFPGLGELQASRAPQPTRTLTLAPTLTLALTLDSNSGLGELQDTCRELARTTGGVTTIGGRCRVLHGIRSEDASERAKAERQAVNSVCGTRWCLCARLHASGSCLMCDDPRRPPPLPPPVRQVVQGSAADVVKEAMLRCCDELGAARVPARLIAQLHDELLWEVRHAPTSHACMQPVSVHASPQRCT